MPFHARVAIGLLTVTCAAVAVKPVHAQDVSVAEALYQDAKRLFAAGDTHAACLKFEASQKADPALGTLLALAACHEKEGKVATAWSEFTDADALAKSRNEADRGEYAREHAAALAPRVQRVVLNMTSPPPDLSVRLGAKTYGVATIGTPLPVDPGDYEVEATAAGKVPWKKTVSISPQGGPNIELNVQLDDARNTPSQPMVVTTSDAPASKRTLGLVLGVGGVVLAGAGAVALVVSKSQGDDAVADAERANQRGSRAAYSSAESARDRAVLTQWLGVGGLAVGAIAAGVGGYLFFSAPRSNAARRTGLQVRPMVGLTSGLVGTF